MPDPKDPKAKAAAKKEAKKLEQEKFAKAKQIIESTSSAGSSAGAPPPPTPTAQQLDARWQAAREPAKGAPKGDKGLRAGAGDCS
eukprot:3978102-Pyramimonas_sp.AAC.1